MNNSEQKLYYLTSGPNKEYGFSDELKKYLKSDITGGKLVIISSSFDKREKNDKYLSINVNWFRLAGIEFDEVSYIDDRISKKEAQEKLKNTDVVLLSGGDTLKQIRSIKEYELIDILKNRNGVTIGVSAGAINMAKNVLCIKYEDVEETVRYEGIGLVDVNIEPHFDFVKEDYNKNNLFPESFQNEIICLPNESSLRIDEEGNITYIGECYNLKNGELRKIKIRN
jgi:dipeptidase E